MQLPSSSAGTDTHIDYGFTAEALVAAWAESGMPTPEGQKVAEEGAATLVTLDDAILDADLALVRSRRPLLKARAAFAIVDNTVDTCVMGLSDGTLNNLCDRDREHPHYKTIFDGTRASALTTGPLAEQPEIIDAMIARLDTVPDFKNKADLRQAVIDANAKAKEKRAALQRAEADADLAYSRLQTARATLRTALTQLHSRLLSVYPDRKDFVESFFLRRKVRKGDTEVETLPETAPPPSA